MREAPRPLRKPDAFAAAPASSAAGGGRSAAFHASYNPAVLQSSSCTAATLSGHRAGVSPGAGHSASPVTTGWMPLKQALTVCLLRRHAGSTSTSGRPAAARPGSRSSPTPPTAAAGSRTPLACPRPACAASSTRRASARRCACGPLSKDTPALACNESASRRSLSFSAHARHAPLPGLPPFGSVRDDLSPKL